MKEIPLYAKDGRVTAHAKVDDSDYERIGHVRWSQMAIYRGDKLLYMYGQAQFNGSRAIMHRVIMNARKGEVVDHKNHDTLDNQKSNLRICTASQNVCHTARRSNPASGERNIAKTSANRWRATIHCQGQRHAKFFKSIEDAKAWRDATIKLLHGEFAHCGHGTCT